MVDPREHSSESKMGRSFVSLDGNVYIYELSSDPHEICSRSIDGTIILKDPERTLINLGSTRKYLTIFLWSLLMLLDNSNMFSAIE